jgi:hypothetical protein
MEKKTSGGKLDEQMHEKIVRDLRRGSYQKVAAQKAGIGWSTFTAWISRGEMEEARVAEGFDPIESEQKYLLFKRDVDIARAAAEIEAVGEVRDAGKNGSWQASAWFLERSFPQRWARHRDIEEIPENDDAANPDDALQKLLTKMDMLAERQNDRQQ